MIRGLYIYLFLQFFIIGLTAQSDNFIFQRYTQENGLPSNAIYSLVQDSSGFLWIGTDKGLCRYDGYNFQEVNVSSNDITYGYKSPKVTDVFIDKVGDVRFRNGDFHYVYDKVNQPTVDLNLRIGRNEERKRNTLQIKTSRNGEVWLFDYSGKLSRYNLQDRTFADFQTSDAMHFKSLSKVSIRYLDRSGNIWVVDDFDNLYKGSFNNYGGLDWLLVTGDDELQRYQFAEDESGNLYAYRSQILKYNPTTNRFETLLNNEQIRAQEINLVKSLVVNENQFFIVGYDDQVLLYNQRTRDFQVIVDDLSTPIQAMIYTQTGTLWLGTADGLVELSQRFAWKYLLHNSNSRTSGRQEVTAITVDKKGYTWLGTKSESLYRIDRRGRIDGYYFGVPVESLAEDKRGNLWASSGNLSKRSLYQYQRRPDTFAVVVPDTQVVANERFNFRSLTIDQNDEIISGGRGRFATYDPTNENFKIIPLDSCAALSFPLNFSEINPIIQDRFGDYWLGVNGTNSLLYRYQPITGQFDCFEIFAKTALNEDIYSIVETGTSTLWIGTSNGLFEFDKLTQRILNKYTTAQGLPTNNICSILKDASEDLWMSTRRGLTYFDLATREISNFSYSEKLEIETFYHQTAYRHSNTGDLFFGGNNGVVQFHPDSLLNFIENTTLPKVIISDVGVLGEPVRRDVPVYEKDSLLLERGENYLDFTYFVPLPGNINCTYRHRLTGFEKDWMYHAEAKPVSYSDLPPGTYQFEVQTQSFNNDWEQNSRELTIVIPPYFWQTFWFKLILGAFIFSTIALAIYLRIRFYKLESEAQEKENQRKTAMLQALSSQMNPHFLYNSLNSINNFIASKDPRRANEYLGDFATLMRMILNHSKMEKISLTKELECLELYLKLEHLRAAHKFDFSINVDNSIDTGKVFVPPMVVQPFVENAIWHGLHHKEVKGHLDLNINREGKQVVCQVIDDGIGIKKAQEMQRESKYKSTGIENVRERLRILNNIKNDGLKVEVKERVTGGVMVEIVLAAID
ncbi:MAG: two-component regulator propeller domain-containing protein [Saprospiraceae bacterium]